ETAAAFHALGLPWIWQPIVPGNIDDVIAQVSKFREKNEVVVFNFCDGDDVNGYPGLSVVHALEESGILFTGADSRFYDISTSKIRIKEALLESGVLTAPFRILPRSGPVRRVCHRLGAPLIVKPAVSASGLGLTPRSVCFKDREIEACRNELTSGE